MANPPPPPPGFVLATPGGVPPPPPGFEIATPEAAAVPERSLPAGVRGKGYMNAEAIRAGGFNPAVGIGETAAQAVTGSLSAIGAGYAGIGQGLLNVAGLGSTPAADRVEQVSGLAYQPRSQSGQIVAGGLASPSFPLNWPGAAGQFLGDKAEQVGAPPLLSAALRTAPDAAAAIYGARNIRSPKSGSIVPGVPGEIGAAIETPRRIPQSPQQVERRNATVSTSKAAPDTEFYHGTSATNVDSILKEGIRPTDETLGFNAAFVGANPDLAHAYGAGAAASAGANQVAIVVVKGGGKSGLLEAPNSRGAAAYTPDAIAPENIDRIEIYNAGAKKGEPPIRTVYPSSFGRDSASAATPQLANVPADLRQPLADAFRRGDRDMAARVIEAESLPIPIKYLEGQAKQNPSLISDELNYRGTDKRVADRLQEQNQALIDNLDEVRRTVSPNVVANDHIQNGQALIDSYKQHDVPVVAEITAAYKALENANGGQLPINGKSFVDAADAALAKKLKGRYLPAAVRGDLDQVREQGGMLTLEQYENLRTNLATAARDADRGTLGGGGNASAAIRIVRNELETMPIEGAAGGIKALADRARSLSKARFEKMRNDPAYESAVDDPTPVGELSPFADDFVKKYVINGKSANIKRMQETLRDDPLAAETVAAAALNYVKKRSGIDLYSNEGNFSQAGYNRALAEIKPKLQQLIPQDAAEILEKIGNVARNAQMRPKGSYVNESNTFTAAAADAVKANVEGGLNSIVPGAQLGSFIRKRRADKRDKSRVDRALDPQKYLSDVGE